MTEKKIIIDEDWKSQVHKEKEQEKPEEQAKEQEKQEKAKPAVGQMPPASLPLLMTTLATQAMVSLGEIPNPFTGKAEVDLEQVKHMIDMLQMLEEKTKGNRTADESAMLGSLLHQLRLGYVMAQNRPQAPAAEPPASSEKS